MINIEKVLAGDECSRCAIPMAGSGHIQSCACCNIEVPLHDNVDQLSCPLCFNAVRSGGIADHINDVHGIASLDTSKLYE